MSKLVIVTETNAPPIVLIFAAKIRRAFEHQSYQQQLKQVEGCFALLDTSSHQQLSIDVSNKLANQDVRITISSGISKPAKITIKTNLSHQKDTKVEGLLRHPLFAIKVGKLLEFPHHHWRKLAETFWQSHQCYPGMPTAFSIKCLDESTELNLTTVKVEASALTNTGQLTIEAKAKDLSEVFAGDEIFLQSVMRGKIKVIGSFEAAVVLSELSLGNMLGQPVKAVQKEAQTA